jgi:phosphoribosyl 1,2-cyclic phosphate phosphodiesterase
LDKLKNIFITHFHEDHINVTEMICRNSNIPSINENVNIYCSPSAAEQMQLLFNRFSNHNDVNPFNYYNKYRIIPLEPYKTHQLGNLRVTPILSSHHGYGINEIGYNYIIEDRNKVKFLYAVDTGWYYDETWEFIKNQAVDYAVIECIYGNMALPAMMPEHLNIDNMLLMVRKMTEINFLKKNAPVYLTHICHLHTLNHDKTQELLSECGFNILVGYDGMEINI